VLATSQHNQLRTAVFCWSMFPSCMPLSMATMPWLTTTSIFGLSLQQTGPHWQPVIFFGNKGTALTFDTVQTLKNMPGARKDASTLYPTGAYHHTKKCCWWQTMWSPMTHRPMSKISEPDGPSCQPMLWPLSTRQWRSEQCYLHYLHTKNALLEYKEEKQVVKVIWQQAA